MSQEEQRGWEGRHGLGPRLRGLAGCREDFGFALSDVGAGEASEQRRAGGDLTQVLAGAPWRLCGGQAVGSKGGSLETGRRPQGCSRGEMKALDQGGRWGLGRGEHILKEEQQELPVGCGGERIGVQEDGRGPEGLGGLGCPPWACGEIGVVRLKVWQGSCSPRADSPFPRGGLCARHSRDTCTISARYVRYSGAEMGGWLREVKSLA